MEAYCWKYFYISYLISIICITNLIPISCSLICIFEYNVKYFIMIRVPRNMYRWKQNNNTYEPTKHSRFVMFSYWGVCIIIGHTCVFKFFQFLTCRAPLTGVTTSRLRGNKAPLLKFLAPDTIPGIINLDDNEDILPFTWMF